jgi:hypothetical protein
MAANGSSILFAAYLPWIEGLAYEVVSVFAAVV